jgi:hypothetical protein
MAIGFATAAATTRLIASMLYGLSKLTREERSEEQASEVGQEKEADLVPGSQTASAG